MTFMRMVFFAMLLGLLLRPVLKLTLKREEQRTLAVLVDAETQGLHAAEAEQVPVLRRGDEPDDRHKEIKEDGIWYYI